jgi:hypothetical protein
MFNADTELLFPPRVIPSLRDLRSEPWKNLVDHSLQQKPDGLDRLAFVLLMVRLSGCTTCHADSFRAMRGCTQCALQTVRRFRGNDEELMEMFSLARQDVEKFMSKVNS